MHSATQPGHDSAGMPDTDNTAFHSHANDMDIIDSYDKLTIGTFLEIQEVQRQEGVEDIDRHISTLSLLTGASEEDILHLPLPEFTELSAKAKFLTAEGFRQRQMAKKYIVGDWELVPVTDYRKLETAQYIDFQSYGGDMDAHMVELLSVILVPKGHRYNEGYDILELQEAIRSDMSVTDGVTVCAFFLTLLGQSIRDMLRYSREEAERMPEGKEKTEILKRIAEQEEAFRTNGGG